MERPGELLCRAKANRTGRKQQAPAAPTQAEAHQAEPAAKHVSQHANYTALMRSHDRVHTRHIGVKG